MEEKRIEWLKENCATIDREALNKMFPEYDQKQLSRVAGELGLTRDLSLMGRIAAKEDDEWLKNNYLTASWEEIKTHFSGLTQKQIIGRAISLGAKKSEVCKWGDFTEEDDRWIVENYVVTPWYKVIIRFEGYDEIQITNRAKFLGIRRKFVKFTDEERDIIQKNYTKCSTIRELILKYNLDRTESSILTIIQKLNVKKRLSWTLEEKNVIRLNYHKMKRIELLKLLPNRNIRQLNLQLQKMGLIGNGPGYQYTEKDYSFIRENYEKMTDVEIGEVLHREPQSIKEVRRKLKLYRQDPDDDTNYHNLSRFLDKYSNQWREKSIEMCENKCFLTGAKFDDVHHLFSRNLIIASTLRDLGLKEIDIEDVNKKNGSFKNQIINAYRKQERMHPYGICLSKDIHIKFHSLYGFGNNTPQQFIEFVTNFFPNKLDETLKYIQQNYNN